MMRLKEKKIIFIALIILGFGIMFSSCTIMEDNKPPSTPLLTVTDIKNDSVSLAWSESYDNVGISEYKLYRDGDVLDEVEDTEYKDKDVKTGDKYEYYVVAYDEAGNRSSKSAKQTVTVNEDAKIASGDVDTPDDNASPDNPKDNGAKQDLNKLAKSTVRLYMLDDDYNCIGTGSGTIMNKQGYILTNYHCVGTENGLNNVDGYVAIALTDDVRVNSQQEYFAKFRGGVPPLDLAVVQITEDINGNVVSPEDLKLNPIKIGDSDAIEMGDGVNILGYPGVGGETITFTSGKVSGYIDEDNDNTIDWIKTDAMVNHGNSGGTAINDQGEMIGIPSAKLPGEDLDVMFLLKPINQALPILEDAIAQGDNPELPPRADPGIENPDTDNPGVEDPDPDNPGVATIDVSGRIIDAYTSEPLLGAAFVVLQAGVTCDDFLNDPQDSMIISYSETDSDGFFYCAGIPSGATYSVIVGADGYIPITEDDVLEVSADASGTLDIGDVTLETGE